MAVLFSIVAVDFVAQTLICDSVTVCEVYLIKLTE